jgi:hypothetical protein
LGTTPVTKYWFDTEFLEDPAYPIELISIGIVAEDGREYYAEVDLDSSVFERMLDHEFIREFVIPNLSRTHMKYKSQIAQEIREFIKGPKVELWGYCSAYDHVVLNQLYGDMSSHPPSWPYYTNDIAQLAHNLGFNHRNFPPLTEEHGTAHNALADARWTRDAYLWLRNKGAVITEEADPS